MGNPASEDECHDTETKSSFEKAALSDGRKCEDESFKSKDGLKFGNARECCQIAKEMQRKYKENARK